MLSDKIKATLKEMKKDYTDVVMIPTMMMAFIEEKELVDEFQEWVENNKEEIRKILE